MPAKTFADLWLSPSILKAVQEKWFTEPSPIQASVIPLLLSGEKDIIGQAQTGTGKTAAFALPILDRLDPFLNKTQAIILTPTRELAIQIAKEIQSFRVEKSPSVMVIYGGNSMYNEIAWLKKNPHIIVGTPGRVQHHIRNKHLHLDHISYFVLDEADEMLNFWFREEIEEVLGLTPPQRRVLLFSATMPRSILSIVHKYMKDHEHIKIESKEMTNENITQKYYCVKQHDRFEALCRIMEDEETFYAIVFCRTKLDTDAVANQLISRHLRAEAIHGDIEQAQREKILSRFRERKTNILVATDVAARGIDITELNFVVNYSLPENYEIYAHRIGRTGRAGKKGTAITFVSGKDIGKLRFFERNLGVHLQKWELPKSADLIKKKQCHLVERLEHIINNEDLSHLMPLAEELLWEDDPKNIITALLKDAYKKDFDLKSYSIILDDTPRWGSSSSSRWGGGGYSSSNRRWGSSSGGYRGRDRGSSSSGGGSRDPRRGGGSSSSGASRGSSYRWGGKRDY